MALYQVTVKKQWRSAGQLIEPGMSVQVPTDILADPILINGGQLIQKHFLTNLLREFARNESAERIDAGK